MTRTLALITFAASVYAQDGAHSTLPPLPAPQAVPKPGPAGDPAYAPLPILPGGIVIRAQSGNYTYNFNFNTNGNTYTSKLNLSNVLIDGELAGSASISAPRSKAPRPHA